MGDRRSKKCIAVAQQELAQNCGFGNDIIWDLLSPNDAALMKNKIKQLIPDRPKGQNEIINLRNTIFKSLWEQRKYTNKLSITYIFYVMVTKDEDFNTAIASTEYSCHPVFRCKKCDHGSDTRNCCMIYVDETGRVYQNWKSYIAENVLPAGTMVAPRNGIYNFDQFGQVILDIYCTPNGKPEAKAMEIAQTGSAVLGFGTACVPIAAIVGLPVAAPLLATASIIGLGVGAFTAVTSALNLSDRKKHGQSISFDNREARANYIGVVSGSVGVAAAGATRVMTSMAAAGKATAGLELLVNGFNVTSIVLSGSGVANGVLDLIFKYNDGDKISSMDILQLSASLVLFTHSIYNFRLASQIANNARNNTIKSYRETLSNRQRKIFDKISKETLRIRGGTQGRIDIIRGVNEIPDRQYLNDLFKINKKLHQSKVRPSFGEAGKNIVLNNEVPVNTAELRQSVQHQQGPNILEQVKQPIPSTHDSDTYTTQTPKEVKLFFNNDNVGRSLDVALEDNDWETVKLNLTMILENGVNIMLKVFGTDFLQNISDIQKFEDIFKCVWEHFDQSVAQFLIQLTQKFISEFKSEIESTIKMIITTESVLYRIFKHVLDKYSDLSYNFISKKSSEIITAIKKHYLEFKPVDSNGTTQKCPDCKGWTTLSRI